MTVFLHEWRAIEHDPAWSHVRKARREFESIVQSILYRGGEEGVFTVREPRLTCLGFLGMIDYSYQWYRPRSSHTADEIAEHFAADLPVGHPRVGGAREPSSSASQHWRYGVILAVRTRGATWSPIDPAGAARDGSVGALTLASFYFASRAPCATADAGVAPPAAAVVLIGIGG